MTTRTERKKAKIRFVGLYSVSLILLFILVSAFWQRLAPKNGQAALQPSDRDAWFVQMDSALHTKMGAMDNLVQAIIKGRQAGAQPDTSAWVALQRSFGKTLDSIDRQAGYLTEGPKKAMMTSVAANFRKALESRQAVLSGLAALPRSTGPVGGPSNEEVNVLKQMLQEKEETLGGLQKQEQTKDETIAALQKQAQAAATNSGSATAGLQATIVQKDKSISSLQVQVTSLQNQLRQKEAALQAASASRPADASQKDKAISTLQSQVASLQNALKQKEAELRTASANNRPVASNGGEWQQKYQSLKASFDKVSASEKSLKGAYQTLADDNRRLLSQLQATRKG